MATHSIERGFISFKEDYRDNSIVLTLLQKLCGTVCSFQGDWSEEVCFNDFKGDFAWYMDFCKRLIALAPYLSSGEMCFSALSDEASYHWKMVLKNGNWEEYDGRVVYDDNLFVDVPDRALLNEVERRDLNAK